MGGWRQDEIASDSPVLAFLRVFAKLRSMNPRFTITHAMTQGLAQIEWARGFLDVAQLSRYFLENLRQVCDILCHTEA